jgi:hypothetical protein
MKEERVATQYKPYKIVEIYNPAASGVMILEKRSTLSELPEYY